MSIRAAIGVALTLFFINSEAVSAEISTGRAISISPAWENYGISIRGDILPGDFEKFQRVVSQVRTGLTNSLYDLHHTTVNIESGGGDVETAIMIGKEIRKLSMKTTTYRDCASSCVLIFVAGVERSTGIALNSTWSVSNSTGIVGFAPRLGIHRPYFRYSQPNLNQAQMRQRIDQMRKQITDYLNEMDISRQVSELMYALPPETMRWLSYDEATKMGIIGKDTTWDELETANTADIYGLSSAQYRAREAASEKLCLQKYGATWRQTDCRVAYIRNIPESLVASHGNSVQAYVEAEVTRGRYIKLGSFEQAQCIKRFYLGYRSC